MRCFIIHCLILAVTVASPENRQKRDLAFLKNLFPSLFESDHNNIVPIAPFYNVVPKYRLIRVPELGNRLFEVPTTKKVDTLLIKEAPIVTESLRKITNEKIFIVPEETDNDSEYKVKVPFETHKEPQNNKPVMTYTTHNNPELIMNEGLRAAIPSCIKQRIGEVLYIGANPSTVETSLNGHKLNNVADTTEPNEKNKVKPITNIKESTEKTPNVHNLHYVFNLNHIAANKTKENSSLPYMTHATSTSKPKLDVTVTSGLVTDKPSFSASIAPNRPTVSSYAFNLLHHNALLAIAMNQNNNKNIPDISNYKLLSKADAADFLSTDFVSPTISNLKDNPIVVLDDNTFAYDRKSLKGLLDSINGSHALGVIDSKTQNRGDIPDIIM